MKEEEEESGRILGQPEFCDDSLDQSLSLDAEKYYLTDK